MFFAGHVIPTRPLTLASDPRFQDPNWTEPVMGLTLRQLAVAALHRQHGDHEQAVVDVDILWNLARAVDFDNMPAGAR